jgi:hypothetical protein
VIDLLAEQLAHSGLRPDCNRSAYIRDRILFFGEMELERVSRVLGPLDLGRSFTINRLGFGYVLTEFATAPVPWKATGEDVFSLGALANLIVVAFDKLADSGLTVEGVMPPEVAHGADSVSASPVARLASEYYRRLRSLPWRRDGVLTSVENAIRRMYQAEVASIHLGEQLPPHLWRRKCCLPFVVMALPAWAREDDFSSSAYLRHLHWLYRVGHFLGALDDAIDFEPDRAQGRPNYWRHSGASMGTTTAIRIARWGSQVLAAWDEQTQGAARNLVLRESFLTTVWAWLKLSEPATLV